MSKKIGILVSSSLIHGGSQFLPRRQCTFKIGANKCSTFTWSRVLHERLLQLFPDIWHPSAVCFRKRQLWLTFKDQYFILRKKTDMDTYEEFLVPNWIWRFWRPENTIQTPIRSLFRLITKIFKSRNNGPAKS